MPFAMPFSLLFFPNSFNHLQSYNNTSYSRTEDVHKNVEDESKLIHCRFILIASLNSLLQELLIFRVQLEHPELDASRYT
jgi:hypothetical protein